MVVVIGELSPFPRPSNDSEDIKIHTYPYYVYLFLGKDTAKYDRNNKPSQLKKQSHSIVN